MKNKNSNELDNKSEEKMVETTKYSIEDQISDYYKNQPKGSIFIAILLFVSFFVVFIVGTPLVFVVYFAIVFVVGIVWGCISSKRKSGVKNNLLKNKNALIKVTTTVVFVGIVASVSIGRKSISRYSVTVEIDGVKMKAETTRQYAKGDLIEVYIHPNVKNTFLFADEVE